ncbi:HetZ-related protein 2 [Plectonema radiosum]|uniref:HetZ-related protein 2 n=1 Tax=Plectonema radiosum TaxID=945768 RepID=UPI00298131F7|nr:tetratricopeptide repeat protein [Plectonema radiosum]
MLLIENSKTSMNQNLSDWDEDLPPEPKEVYQDLVRALKRKAGFGLFFVQCTPAESDSLIAKLPQDIPQKKIEVLRLVEPIDNLYQRVAEFVKGKQVDILLIKGLEYSLYKYEKRNFDEITEGQFSNLSSVPPILNHLNQHRERFRDDFKFGFVFLLWSFSINYLIHRAPDFFDWRSGVFELPTTPEVVDNETSRLLDEADYEEYLKLSPEEKIEKILEIQELLIEKHPTEIRRASLLFKLGNLLVAANEYEGAIVSYNEAVKIIPDYYQARYNRGIALQNLERYEEAIASFDEAVKIKPDFYLAWNNRGAVLCDHLQRYEDAIAAFDQAVYIQPEFHEAWYNKGIALYKLRRFQQAIASLDKALKIKPDDHKAWYARGKALYGLNFLEEAMASYNKTIELKPDYVEASHLPVNALDKLAIENFLFKVESLLSDVVSYEEYNLPIPSLAAKLAHYWRSQLFFECPEQSEINRESIINWLLGKDLGRFEKLNSKELDIAKRAMEYRYRILRQRYLGMTRERAYRNLITRLGSLVTLRNKIQTWISLSRDRQRSVVDVLQEVLQELLQSDNYMQQQMASIAEFTTDARLQNSLLFASMEEYCLRPVRNQPLLVYRFVNYLRRTQRGGLTQVPGSDLIKLDSQEILTQNEEIVTENIENRVELLDSQAIAQYQEAQQLEEQQVLRKVVKQEFENYLQENIGQQAVEWLRLYMQGKSQDEIAKKLNKPIKEVYRLREKISYYAVRVFAVKGKPELVDNWLEISLNEHNLGLTPQQWQQLQSKLTSIERQVLSLRKAGKSIEEIALSLKLKTHQVMGEWSKIYLAAQTLRSQE